MSIQILFSYFRQQDILLSVYQCGYSFHLFNYKLLEDLA